MSKLLKVVRLFVRLFKVGKLIEGNPNLKRLEEQLFLWGRGPLVVMKMCLGFLYISHVMACFLGLVGQWLEPQDSWIWQNDLQNLDVPTQYVCRARGDL